MNATVQGDLAGAPANQVAAHPWTRFYQAVAHGLLAFRKDRKPLVRGLLELQRSIANLGYLTRDQFADGRAGPLEDIDPFTAMATFNRTQNYVQRTVIARNLAEFLGVDVPPPTSFAGIPIVNAVSSWFFGFSKDRGEHDIDRLWAVFGAAGQLASGADPDARAAFARAYDQAMRVRNVKWNLTFGLFWAYPYSFASLSSKARPYVESALGTRIGPPLDAAAYLALIDRLRDYFRREDAPVHSFPDLALAAWRQEQSAADGGPPAAAPSALAPRVPMPPPRSPDAPAYSVQDILDDGCFLSEAEIENALARLHDKKNLILQGPPGTGKTWLARRLAYACVGRRDAARVQVVQFHANASYEDLVCGLRPDDEGRLTLADGPILEAVERARAVSGQPFVLVIEEFNRGNPAQIFGELLTLLEADKRSPVDAVRLMYPTVTGQPRVFYVPDNFHLIGTMNVADRSLAVLDRALRRRFAFVDLKPVLNGRWERWLLKRGVDAAHVHEIRARIERLNGEIGSDPKLGAQCAVGHSFVTPRAHVDDAAGWFADIVRTEIGPLLEDYWFDEPKRARDARDALLDGWPPA